MYEKECVYARCLGNWLRVNCDDIKISNFGVSMSCKKSGRTISGVMPVIIQLAKESSTPNALGESLNEEAQVRQWLEYALWIHKATSVIAQQNLLEVLNKVLSSRTYIVGNKQTLADIALYQALHDILVEMTYAEKEKFLHLGRWFDLIQGDKLVRQSNSLVLIGRILR